MKDKDFIEIGKSCRSFLPEKGITRHGQNKSNLIKAIKEERRHGYWLFDLSEQRGEKGRRYIYDRRFICRDCVQIFSDFAMGK